LHQKLLLTSAEQILLPLRCDANNGLLTPRPHVYGCSCYRRYSGWHLLPRLPNFMLLLLLQILLLLPCLLMLPFTVMLLVFLGCYNHGNASEVLNHAHISCLF
jgi:hypothetical protein